MCGRAASPPPDDKTVEVHVFHDPAQSKEDLLASLLDDFAMSEVDAWFAAHAAALHGSAYVRTLGRDRSRELGTVTIHGRDIEISCTLADGFCATARP